MLKKILAFCNHQRYQVIAGCVCVLLTIWGLSCESRVQSLTDPRIKVTREELRVEVDRFLAMADIRFKSLDRHDELKALVFDKLIVWSTTGGFNPMGLIPLIVGVLGGAAITDNVRNRVKNKKPNDAGTSDTA